MNLKPILQKLFCKHRKRELVGAEWTDGLEGFTCIETWKCKRCGKEKDITYSGLIANQKLERRSKTINP